MEATFKWARDILDGVLADIPRPDPYQIPHDAVREATTLLAYVLWCRAGKPQRLHGHHDHFWYHAEEIIRRVIEANIPARRYRIFVVVEPLQQVG